MVPSSWRKRLSGWGQRHEQPLRTGPHCDMTSQNRSKEQLENLPDEDDPVTDVVRVHVHVQDSTEIAEKKPIYDAYMFISNLESLQHCLLGFFGRPIRYVCVSRYCIGLRNGSIKGQTFDRPIGAQPLISRVPMKGTISLCWRLFWNCGITCLLVQVSLPDRGWWYWWMTDTYSKS